MPRPDKPRLQMASEELAIELLTTGQALEGGRPEAERLLLEIKNNHAHQLAERQREALRQTDDPVFYEGEAGWLANLIDPKVQR